MPGKFVVKQGSTGKFRFNLVSTNGQVVATSEAYDTKAAAMKGIRAVKSLAADAVVNDESSSTASPAAKVAAGKAASGKAASGKAASGKATAAKAAGPAPAGGACGYAANVALFGGPPERRGCGQTEPPGNARSASPQVTLPEGGSTASIAAADEDGVIAVYGPAVILGGRYPGTNTGPTGPVVVSTKGKTSVTSSASVKSVDAGVLTAASVRSTCTASKSGMKGSATLTNCVVVTASDADGNPTSSKAVPSKPPANHRISGKNTIGDKFRVVFNEQKKAKDGTLTVVAVHLYLLGPTAVGDVVIAECHARV